MHAATNHLVDAVLALILMIGGVIGAQFGARTGQKCPRRAAAAAARPAACSAVGLRFAYDLVVRPRRPLFDPPGGAGRKRSADRRRSSCWRIALTRARRAPNGWSRSLSTSRVLITSNFTGAEVVLFGSVERDAQTVARRGGYDIVVTVSGPRETAVTFRKERVVGIWVNVDSRTFVNAPSLSHRAGEPRGSRRSPTSTRCGGRRPGIARTLLPQDKSGDIADSIRDDPFRQAFLRLKIDRGLYRETQNGVTFLTPGAVSRRDPDPRQRADRQPTRST